MFIISGSDDRVVCRTNQIDYFNMHTAYIKTGRVVGLDDAEKDGDRL